jgi:acetolactate decarboxylase
MPQKLRIGALIAVVLMIGAIAYAAVAGAVKEGMVEYVGAQRDVFKTGKATSVVSLEELAGRKNLYAMGPIDGLDGEITIFDSKPYITQVRGDDYTVDKTFKHGAFFLVWTEQQNWTDIPLPATVKGYVDLQRFVKEAAQKSGIDATKPFPFLLSGAPAEIKWHINVDRTEGKPITKESFYKSKQPFVTKNEPVDIIGFYAEHRDGIFLPKYTSVIKEGSGMENHLHIHLVSKTSKAAGHIDDISFGDGMVLRLPKP